VTDRLLRAVELATRLAVSPLRRQVAVAPHRDRHVLTRSVGLADARDDSRDVALELVADRERALREPVLSLAVRPENRQGAWHGFVLRASSGAMAQARSRRKEKRCRPYSVERLCEPPPAPFRRVPPTYSGLKGVSASPPVGLSAGSRLTTARLSAPLVTCTTVHIRPFALSVSPTSGTRPAKPSWKSRSGNR
jgi:hypothetical protein